MSVWWMLKPNFDVYTGVIVLTSLPKLIKALMPAVSFQKQSG